MLYEEYAHKPLDSSKIILPLVLRLINEHSLGILSTLFSVSSCIHLCSRERFSWMDQVGASDELDVHTTDMHDRCDKHS